MEKLATLETTSRPISPVRNASKSRCRSLTLVVALDHRGVQGGGELVELVEVLADHQRRLARVPARPAARPPRSCWCVRPRAGSAPPARRSRRRAARPSGSVTRTSTQSAGAIQPCDSMSFHGRVVPLGADQREHVALAAVLADQRRGQAEPPAGLQVGGHPEDRRRQQVDLVVHDQAPVAGVEQLEVGVDALPAGGQHLVRRDGDRADLLRGTGVLADLVGGQRRPPDQLVLPLACRDGVGDQDQRGRLGVAHRGRADQGLAGAARQHDDARAAVPEGLDRLGLVGPQRPVGLVERDRVRLAVDVPGEVLGRPAQLEQRLLEVAALGGVHHHGVVVEPVAEHAGDLLGRAAPPPAPARSLLTRTRPCTGCFSSRSRP